jgi:Aldo/keto reductase family
MKTQFCSASSADEAFGKISRPLRRRSFPKRSKGSWRSCPAPALRKWNSSTLIGERIQVTVSGRRRPCPGFPIAQRPAKSRPKGSRGPGLHGGITLCSLLKPFTISTTARWRVIDALQAVATEVGKTPAQVAINWLLRKPGVTAPIIGARHMNSSRQTWPRLIGSWTPST